MCSCCLYLLPGEDTAGENDGAEQVGSSGRRTVPGWGPHHTGLVFPTTFRSRVVKTTSTPNTEPLTQLPLLGTRVTYKHESSGRSHFPSRCPKAVKPILYQVYCESNSCMVPRMKQTATVPRERKLKRMILKSKENGVFCHQPEWPRAPPQGGRFKVRVPSSYDGVSVRYSVPSPCLSPRFH